MTHAGEPLLGAGAGVVTTYVGNTISGEETTWTDVGFSAVVGAASTEIPGGPTQSNSLQQMARFNPSTLSGAFNGVQSQRLWGSVGLGTAAGAGADLFRDGYESGAYEWAGVGP